MLAAMSERPVRNGTTLAGYVVGMGMVAVAVLGVPLQFAYPDVSNWLIYLGAFAVGGVVGAVLGATRGVRA